ncbi:hypothetical protein GCK72_017340 [Caenorhabditis remanei]|uniref:Uncharacterized protein n=1 Tax=Caenorhabditis remanei TaxID=31234 RepID=A0A6A5G8F6_CAERE|nr:hypothetical protein GCK72_017340 [Caenorhabditis remanei]KAF1750789.1 hypothetical protein GCK72_017340 [Caenorhabditis remanei]
MRSLWVLVPFMDCIQLASSCDEPYRLLGTIHDGTAWRLHLGWVGIPRVGSTYLLSEGKGIARHSQENSFLWVEDSTWWINSESLHIGRLDSVSNTASRRVDHLDVVGVLVVVWGIEDDLGVWLGLDVSWWDGLSHGVGVQGF